MKAAVYCGPRDIQVMDVPKPEINANEILVKVQACGICGSDLHTLSGQRQEKTPCILGHEAVGRIVATGGKRETWKRGQRQYDSFNSRAH